MTKFFDVLFPFLAPLVYSGVALACWSPFEKKGGVMIEKIAGIGQLLWLLAMFVRYGVMGGLEP